jgi:hypothetical protein
MNRTQRVPMVVAALLLVALVCTGCLPAGGSSTTTATKPWTRPVTAPPVCLPGAPVPGVFGMDYYRLSGQVDA